jgi:hypothetical protein
MCNCMVDQVHFVRVMRSDGEILEFEEPVIAKQLMKVYPGHLVVHCSPVTNKAGLGERSKVSMLRSDETLEPGQTYCLLKVPTTQRGKIGVPQNGSLKSYFAQSNSTQQDQNTTPQALPPLTPLQQSQFGGPWRPHLDAIIESPLHSATPSRSFTMSPLARQAGYTPMSTVDPARVAPSPSPRSKLSR